MEEAIKLAIQEAIAKLNPTIGAAIKSKQVIDAARKTKEGQGFEKGFMSDPASETPQIKSNADLAESFGRFTAHGTPAGGIDDVARMGVPVMGAMVAGIDDVSKTAQPAINYLRTGQRAIGDVMDEALARARFNIPELKRLSGGGSDRDVFDLGDKVLKIAKSARGLAQNSSGRDYYASDAGLIPQLIEEGKNYNIFEKVDPPNANVKAMIKEINKIGIPFNKYSNDWYNQTQQILDTMEKYGYPGNELLNYGQENIMWGDLMAIRNWGTKNGVPILVDDGTLGGSRMISDYQGVKNMNDPEFRSIYFENRNIKKQLGDKDKYTMYGAALLPPVLQNNEKER